MSVCLERLVERPNGLSGYRPAFWCAICGRKASLQTDKQCIKEDCPNLCHARCLGGKTEFSCGNTGQLRAEAGIADPVTFHNRAQPVPSSPSHPPPTSPPPSPTGDAGEEEDEYLHGATKEELVSLVKNLKQELASNKSHLTNYRTVTAELRDKRRVLVEALAVVDTLLATYDIEEKQFRSVACTAKPNKIDSAVVTDENVLPPPPPIPPPSSPAPSTPLRPTHAAEAPADENVLPPPPPIPPPSSPAPSPPPRPTYAAGEEDPSPPPSRNIGEGSTESEAERQQYPQQGTGSNKKKKKKKKPASGGDIAQREERAAERRLPPFSGQTQPRQQQQQVDRCPQCKRQGHTRDQCPRKPCDYCQGRFHSSVSCRVKIADQRQQELVQAVRQSSQETLVALRSVAWQLHLPATQQRQAGPSLVAPHGPPVPQPTWPYSTPAYAAHYGVMPQHHGAPPQAWQQ